MKQETLEEAAERLYPKEGEDSTYCDLGLVQQYAFVQGAKWQQDRNKYSEEEVINILVEFSAEIKKVWNITEWFEQFKNKQ